METALVSHFGIVMSLIGILFVSVIGVYAWTYKVSQDTNRELSKVYGTINGHFQNAEIHEKKDRFVDAKVCNAVHKGLDDKVEEIRCHVKKLVSAGN